MYLKNALERPSMFLDKGILVQSFALPLAEFNSLSSNLAQASTRTNTLRYRLKKHFGKAFSKRCVLIHRFHRIRANVDDIGFRDKEVAFLVISVDGVRMHIEPVGRGCQI